MNEQQSSLHTEHGAWLKALDFYREEIHVLERRLAEVAGRKNDFEARQGIEHFQNQFVVQRNNIDEARHRVHAHEEAVDRHNAQHVEVSSDGQEHSGIRTEMEGLIKVWEELKKEFDLFCLKWS